MTWFLFAIASLAVYRAARMVAEEDGPFFVFKRLRDRLDDPKSSLSVGIRCFYCVSVWLSLPAALLLMLFAGWNEWLWPLWWFGIAGLAAKIHEFWGKR